MIILLRGITRPFALCRHFLQPIAAQQAAITVYVQIAAHPLKIANPFANHQTIAPLAGHGAPPDP
jgi:hypothetical protein